MCNNFVHLAFYVLILSVCDNDFGQQIEISQCLFTQQREGGARAERQNYPERWGGGGLGARIQGGATPF
jgi:hypothetical protein